MTPETMASNMEARIAPAILFNSKDMLISWCFPWRAARKPIFADNSNEICLKRADNSATAAPADSVVMRQNAAISRVHRSERGAEGATILSDAASAFRPIVVIPARLASTRLPGKPLADISGLPMIVHVLRRAEAAGVGPVAVAAGDSEIVDAVESLGGRAVLTDPALPSGSDRIRAALEALDPDGRCDSVINLQGDMPFVEPETIKACARLLADVPACDIATSVAAESGPEDRSNPDVVK